MSAYTKHIEQSLNYHTDRLNERYEECLYKQNKLEKEHPTYCRIFFDSEAGNELFNQFSENTGYCANTHLDKIEFLHTLINYHIQDDGGYRINPEYFITKIENEAITAEWKAQEKPNRDIIERIKGKYKEKDLPTLFIQTDSDGEWLNGNGDDYEAILKVATKFIEEYKVKIEKRKKNMKRYFGKDK